MIHTFVDPPEDYYYSDEAALQGPAQVPAALEKTRMCVYYLQGRCKYDDCSFAHSATELKQAPSNLRKTKMCDLFLSGLCLDSHCNFAHSMDEIKFRPKRAPSATLSPTMVGSRTAAPEVASANSEFCARTILSMLIKMEPEAAVAFLSNPECKQMLERLLEEKPAPAHREAEYGMFPTPLGSSVGLLTPQLESLLLDPSFSALGKVSSPPFDLSHF